MRYVIGNYGINQSNGIDDKNLKQSLKYKYKTHTLFIAGQQINRE